MLRAFLLALAWLPALVGLGTVAPIDVPPPLRAPLRGWFGLAALAAAALAFNLAAPLSPWLAASILAAGWGLFLYRLKAIAAGVRFAELAAVACLLAVLAGLTRPIGYHYDSGLYHLQLVKWAVQKRVVPGLGLVHDRFGTASFWPPLCALLEIPGVGEGGSAAFAALIPSTLALWTSLAALRLRGDATRFGAAALAGLPLVLFAQPWELGGLGPDLPLALLVYLCLALWALALSAPEEEPWASPAALFLAAVALALKLSAAAVFAASLAAVVWRWRAVPRRAWLGAALSGSLLLALEMARNLMTTGCLVYPAASSCLPLPWRVPAETVRNLDAWTRSWARMPGPPPDQVLSSWRWLGPWFARVGAQNPIRFLGLALAAGFALCAAARKRPPTALLAPCGAAVVGVLFWFFTAPDPRFGFGVLAAAALFPLAWGLTAAPRLGGRVARGAALAGWLAAVGALAWVQAEGLGPERLPESGWQSLPVPTLVERPTSYGLEVTTPFRDDRCWDAPLLCTPMPQPRLRWTGQWFELGR